MYICKYIGICTRIFRKNTPSFSLPLKIRPHTHKADLTVRITDVLLILTRWWCNAWCLSDGQDALALCDKQPLCRRGGAAEAARCTLGGPERHGCVAGRGLSWMPQRLSLSSASEWEAGRQTRRQTDRRQVPARQDNVHDLPRLSHTPSAPPTYAHITHALTSFLTIELLQSIHAENTFFGFMLYTSILYVYILHILYLDLQDAAYTQLYSGPALSQTRG